MNSDTALKNTFSSVRNFKSNILITFCVTRVLKLEFLQQMYATQLFCIFFKANTFSETQPKKLQILLISKFEKLFLGYEFSSYLAGLYLLVVRMLRQQNVSNDVRKDSPLKTYQSRYG